MSIFKYEVTTNFDESVTLLTDWQEAVAHVRVRAREANRSKNDFNINPFKP